MTGIVVPLMEQRHLDFSYLANSEQEILTLHAELPVALYKSGLLMVRVHENNIPAKASFQISLYPTLPCKTDGRQFTNTELSVASVLVLQNDCAPVYLHSPIEIVNAAYLLIQIHAKQGGSTQKFSAQLSAELLLREE